MGKQLLVVSHFGENSVADKAGIREGEAILSYGGVEVSMLSELKRAIEANRLNSGPVEVVLCSVNSLGETRTVQCAPGSLGAHIKPWDSESKADVQTIIGSDYSSKNSSATQSSVPGIVKFFAYTVGVLGVLFGIWLLASFGFVDQPYGLGKTADPIWIAVGLAMIVQSVFFSAFSLLSVMTWENTHSIRKLLLSKQAEGVVAETGSTDSHPVASRES